MKLIPVAGQRKRDEEVVEIYEPGVSALGMSMNASGLQAGAFTWHLSIMPSALGMYHT